MSFDKQTLNTPVNPTKSIAQRIQLVPNHVIKLLYRQGEGPYAKPGYSVNAYFNCSLIDGTEITKKKNIQRRFPVGSKRLIEGLQIALLSTRRHEKFTLIISPEYGYKNIQIKHFIPKNEKLIFEFEIVSIDFIPFDQKSQIQVLTQIKLLYEQVDPLLQKAQYKKALQVLHFLAGMVKSIKYYKNDIFAIIFLKRANILYHLKRYQQANEWCKVVNTIQPSTYRYLVIHTKISLELKNKEQTKSLMTKIHDLYGQREEIKRMYVEYLKKNQDYNSLRYLQGYDYIKDKIINQIEKIPKKRKSKKQALN